MWRGAVSVDHVTMTRPTPHTRMFQSVVWATDGSPQSVAVLGLVRDACERYHSALWIVHVAPALSTGAGERRIVKLKSITSSLRRRGVHASLHVVRGALGPPGRHIAEVARMVGADLVIVTPRGRSPLAGAVAGSTTLAMIAEAPCPVLALPATVAAASSGWPAVTPLLTASA
jgi:nucleotide-binding universal stress UspA family protein